MTQTNHRRAAGSGRQSGFTWTSLGGQTRIFVPWRDLLENGRPTDERFNAVRDALYEYDRRLEAGTPHARELSGDAPRISTEEDDDSRDLGVPPLPTPHAEVIAIDDGEFEAELAVRLVEHKGRMADMHG